MLDTPKRRCRRTPYKTVLLAPSGKGGHVIVLNAGSENGFVNGASLVFQAKRSVASDYHSEMNSPRFERWFKEQLFPNIEPRSVIVIDNASYHSFQLKKLPSTSSRKAEIKSWWTKKQKQKYSMALAKVDGHDIVWLPPYHCDFNPIVMVWSQVNGYSATNNRLFAFAGGETLLDKAIALMTPENWARDCAHVVRLEEEAWEQDGAIGSVLDCIIITLGSYSSSCRNNDVSKLSGIEEL
ncbi:uncharacterized protein LOC142789977 [Rhipicephalus microplus]|uniref:uncharacterized protein LOC142789977 n=1 Tax=Rhipicephalus microplus TaxID=6941 RepID=UPI003F6B3B09